MICQYGKGECSERALYRIFGDQEGPWGESQDYIVDVCDEHSQVSCFEAQRRIWIGGNVPPPFNK